MVDPDPAWQAAFEQERRILTAAWPTAAAIEQRTPMRPPATPSSSGSWRSATNDRDRYVEGKPPFVEAMVGRAGRWQGGGGSGQSSSR